MLPLTRLTPFYPGQFGVLGSDAPLGIRTMPYGKVFYVHNSHPLASDRNDGTNPDGPLSTITQALAQCTANQDDFIIVQGMSNSLETWPIAITKSKVHLLSSQYILGEKVPGHGRILTPPGDTACIYITGDRVEVAGFDMSAGATHGCFEFHATNQSWGAHIHHNRMGWAGAAQDGIRMTGTGDKVHFFIHDNEFNDKITRDGIRIEQNATRSEIWNNIFRVPAGVGINLVTLCTDIFAIHDNFFRVNGATQGDAIYCNANSLGCMFYNNQAMHLGAAPAQNPYEDAGANHWGLNWTGDAVTYPV